MRIAQSTWTEGEDRKPGSPEWGASNTYIPLVQARPDFEDIIFETMFLLFISFYRRQHTLDASLPVLSFSFLLSLSLSLSLAMLSLIGQTGTELVGRAASESTETGPIIRNPSQGGRSVRVSVA